MGLPPASSQPTAMQIPPLGQAPIPAAPPTPSLAARGRVLSSARASPDGTTPSRVPRGTARGLATRRAVVAPPLPPSLAMASGPSGPSACPTDSARSATGSLWPSRMVPAGCFGSKTTGRRRERPAAGTTSVAPGAVGLAPPPADSLVAAPRAALSHMPVKEGGVPGLGEGPVPEFVHAPMAVPHGHLRRREIGVTGAVPGRRGGRGGVPSLAAHGW